MLLEPSISNLYITIRRPQKSESCISDHKRSSNHYRPLRCPVRLAQTLTKRWIKVGSLQKCQKLFRLNLNCTCWLSNNRCILETHECSKQRYMVSMRRRQKHLKWSLRSYYRNKKRFPFLSEDGFHRFDPSKNFEIRVVYELILIFSVMRAQERTDGQDLSALDISITENEAPETHCRDLYQKLDKEMDAKVIFSLQSEKESSEASHKNFSGTRWTFLPQWEKVAESHFLF